MELKKSSNNKDINLLKKNIFKTSFCISLPIIIFIISTLSGLYLRAPIMSKIQDRLYSHGQIDTVEKVGLRKYISENRNFLFSSKSKHTFNIQEWQSAVLSSVISNNDLNKLEMYIFCEILDLQTCFGKKHDNRSLLNISSGNKESFYFFSNNIDEYFAALHKTIKSLNYEAIATKLNSLHIEWSKKYPLLRKPDINSIKQRVAKLSYVTKSNYLFVNRDFILTDDLNRKTPIANLFIEDGELVIQNLTHLKLELNELRFNESSIDLQHVVINPSTPYTPPTEIRIMTNFDYNYLKQHLLSFKNSNQKIEFTPHYNSILVKRALPYTDRELKKLGFTINDKEIVFPSGKLNLIKPIISQEKRIIIHGPLEVIASSQFYLYSKKEIKIGMNGKVVFHSNKDETWGGILISEASELSEINNTSFKDIHHFEHEDIKLTGAINFYRSAIQMNNVNFIHNKSEDMLNIISSHFNLNHISIENTPSDAFDSDFSHGQIKNSSFKNIGGDGFDVSGTTATISKTSFSNINDKGISVGEGSTITSFDNTLENTGTGIASKDRSVATDKNSSFKNIRHSVFASFVKKPEYGPASIIIENPKFINSPNISLVQNGSKLVLNGKEVIGENINIKEIYNSGYMKK